MQKKIYLSYFLYLLINNIELIKAKNKRFYAQIFILVEEERYFDIYIYILILFCYIIFRFLNELYYYDKVQLTLISNTKKEIEDENETGGGYKSRQYFLSQYDTRIIFKKKNMIVFTESVNVYLLNMT